MKHTLYTNSYTFSSSYIFYKKIYYSYINTLFFERISTLNTYIIIVTIIIKGFSQVYDSLAYFLTNCILVIIMK